MDIYKYPNKEKWKALVKRPVFNEKNITQITNSIINDVKKNGDNSLIRFTRKYDGANLNRLDVTADELKEAVVKVPDELKESIQVAYNNIKIFHESQKSQENMIETTPGVKCWRKSVAIEKIGLYIPGGSAPLFSTILMLGVPAHIAGCKEIVLCTPPNKNGYIDPTILYTANLAGIKKIYKIGGAQAISALAYGTETISQVYKIFGPGNQYVTKAKEIVQQSGVAIDVPAGPSEVLVIADKTCNPIFVAADLLAQAEHGRDSQVILLSNSESVVNECLVEISKQIQTLPRIQIAESALKNSKAIILDSIDECIVFSNIYAPEHLIIASSKSNYNIEKIKNAGSVFIGNYSCEAAGDYASGTNHTLPTNGYARNYSGVSLDSFVKKITFQEISKKGIKNIGTTIEILANAEKLIAHKNSVSVRLKVINND